MINWYYFPKTDKITNPLKDVLKIFKKHENEIKAKSETERLESNEVLSILSKDLETIEFRIEKGKKKLDKIEMPVLFKENGVVEKQFYVDGYNKVTKTVLEVESGTTIANNSFLMDLIKACLIKETEYLVLAVRNTYRGQKDYQKVATFFDAIYLTDRLKLPLKGILLIGY